MKITAEFNSVEEMQLFTKTFRGDCAYKPIIRDTQNIKEDKPKENKKDKAAPVEDKKEDVPKVEAEITGVDETPTDQPKDVEVKDETPKNDEPTITKEMVSAKFKEVIKSGKQKEAKQLIENLGAKKLSDVKHEDYPTLMSQAEALL
jgi:hypothetical protein